MITPVAPVDGADRPAGAGPRRPRWGRRVGAGLFWGLIQGVFLLLPPLLGVVVNLAVAAGFVWWFALRPAARANRRRAATLRLRPVAPAVLRWLVPAAVALVGVVLTSLLVMPRFIRLPPERETFLDEYLRRPFAPVALFCLVALVAPLLEEFLFRGWMQRSLERRMAPWRAIVLTGLTFGAVHLEAFGFPLRVAFGIASGYAAWRTRSIWPSVVLHGAYNGSLVLLSGALPTIDVRTLDTWARTDRIFYPALAGLALSGLALSWLLRRLGDAADAARADRIAPDAVGVASNAPRYAS